MSRLIIQNGRLVDPKNKLNRYADIVLEDGHVAEIAEHCAAQPMDETIDATGHIVMPGIIDMHTHMRTSAGHPHAQHMAALAGYTTVLDMAGPLNDILAATRTHGAGINIAITQTASFLRELSSGRPSASEQDAFIAKTLEAGAIGIKLLGGHFPMDLDVTHSLIDACSKANAWIGWHAGNTVHGSNIDGMRDAVEVADGHFLHLAHINTYCRGLIRGEIEETLEAIELLNTHPQIFSESYLSPLNGARLAIVNDVPQYAVTAAALRKIGCAPTRDGMHEAITRRLLGVVIDDGSAGRLVYGEQALEHWLKHDTRVHGMFAVNPAVSRLMLAQAKRQDGSFTVDTFSTDGGSYPRNVIVENGLALVQLGAITLSEFVLKASTNGAKALGLTNKGHLGLGADADVTILDPIRHCTVATIVGGRCVMRNGRVTGRNATIICDVRGERHLKAQGFATCVKSPLVADDVARRLHA